MKKHPLAKYLDAHGITATDLAGRIGVDKSTLSRWINGERTIHGVYVLKVARATGIPVAELRPDLARMFA